MITLPNALSVDNRIITPQPLQTNQLNPGKQAPIVVINTAYDALLTMPTMPASYANHHAPIITQAPQLNAYSHLVAAEAAVIQQEAERTAQENYIAAAMELIKGMERLPADRKPY